jgi:hypothetical protein
MYRGLEVFSPAHRSTSYSELGTDPIEMTNADQETEAPLQRCLNHVTRRLGSLTTRCFQPRAHWFAQFGWMPVPAIIQGCFSSRAHLLQQLIGR